MPRSPYRQSAPRKSCQGTNIRLSGVPHNAPKSFIHMHLRHNFHVNTPLNLWPNGGENRQRSNSGGRQSFLALKLPSGLPP